MKKKYTYKAVIDGERVEWISGKPKTHVPIEVEISVWEDLTGMDEVKGKVDMEKAVAALRKIAEMGGTGIEDPLEWQREIRKDRPLPGRD